MSKYHRCLVLTNSNTAQKKMNILLAIIAQALNAAAQEYIKINGGTSCNFNGQRLNSFEVNLDSVSRTELTSHWEKYLKLAI